MPERANALTQFLKTQTAVTGIAGARIYDEEMPDSAVRAMPKATILVQSTGGGRTIGGPDNDFSDGRIDIKCYAWTKSSAKDLERVVYNALRHLTRVVVGDTLVHWCRDSGGMNCYYEPQTPITPSTPVDKEKSWPVAHRAWQVLISDIPVPIGG